MPYASPATATDFDYQQVCISLCLMLLYALCLMPLYAVCMPYASPATATDFDYQQVYMCLMPYASLCLMPYAPLCRMPYASPAAATDFDYQQVCISLCLMPFYALCLMPLPLPPTSTTSRSIYVSSYCCILLYMCADTAVCAWCGIGHKSYALCLMTYSSYCSYTAIYVC